jgi:hypothetical protein
MVQTRSGAGIPSTPPREMDVPEQIEVNMQDQHQGTPLSRVAEPNQTPRQTPEVYIAGTLTARPTLERSPSIPRNFRPTQFAFMPHPDFQSAREQVIMMTINISLQMSQHNIKELINYYLQATSSFKHP